MEGDNYRNKYMWKLINTARNKYVFLFYFYVIISPFIYCSYDQKAEEKQDKDDGKERNQKHNLFWGISFVFYVMKLFSIMKIICNSEAY